MIQRLVQPAALAVVAAHVTLIAAAWWALQHVVPDTLVLHVFGGSHVLTGLHARIIDRAAEAGFLLPGVFFVEYLWMGWRQCSVHRLLAERSPSIRTDIVCYLFELAPGSALISGVMSLGAVYLSGTWIRHQIAHATGVEFSIAGWPLALQAAILFGLYTFLDYWNHRLDHSRLFWPLHRFHHSAESFAVLTAARVHPAAFTAVISATLPGVLLGSDTAALADVALVVITIRLLVHSGIDSDFGWVGRWIVQSPLHHRLHHSLNRMPINLALLPIWDRLFGTWREVRSAPMRIGTPTPYRQGLWILPDIWRDYCEFWSILAARLITPIFARRITRAVAAD